MPSDLSRELREARAEIARREEDLRGERFRAANLKRKADAAEGLAERNAELEESLATLRDAWNAHFKRCTLDSEVIAQLSADGSIFEQVREWMNAPSNTASADLKGEKDA